MKFLENLPPAQRMAVLIGVPVIAVAALVSMLRRPQTAEGPPPSASTTATTAGQTLPVAVRDDAIGVGELSEFGSILTRELQNVRRTIEEQENGRTVTAAATATPVTVAPAGETWRELLQRVYRSTNLWGAVRAEPRNAALIQRYPNVDSRLPGGAVAYMPARNW